MKNIKLLHGDCLELLKTIPDKSIDLVLTDPPYGTTACKWDTVIPFEPMWKELKRIRKDNAAIVLFGSEPFSSHLRMSNIDFYKYDWFWDKAVSGSFAQAKRMPLRTVESISVFAFDKTHPKYFPQMIKRDKTRKIGGIGSEKTASGSIPVKSSYEFMKNKTYAEAYPKAVLNFSPRADKSRGMHPTQKPVALLEYLIKTYTLEGETVLDFTMGSGSTGVAAKNLGRSFIGIEKDVTYYDIATKRIYETLVVKV